MKRSAEPEPAVRAALAAQQTSPQEMRDAHRLIAAAEFGTPVIASLHAGESSTMGCEPIVELQGQTDPCIVADVRDAESNDCIRLLQAFATLFRLGHPSQLTILEKRADSTADLTLAIEATVDAEHRDRITVIAEEGLGDGQLHWLARFARATINVGGDWSELETTYRAVTLERESESRSSLTATTVDPRVEASVNRTADDANDPSCDNGFGKFSNDGHEYVIRLEPDTPNGGPPLPWVNVIANEQGGCLISEMGAGYTWSKNSRQSRLTPWSNDPLNDPHGESFYLRDEESGATGPRFPVRFGNRLPTRCATGLDIRLSRIPATGSATMSSNSCCATNPARLRECVSRITASVLDSCRFTPSANGC